MFKNLNLNYTFCNLELLNEIKNDAVNCLKKDFL